jgi:hypothetical protein
MKGEKGACKSSCGLVDGGGDIICAEDERAEIFRIPFGISCTN